VLTPVIMFARTRRRLSPRHPLAPALLAVVTAATVAPLPACGGKSKPAATTVAASPPAAPARPRRPAARPPAVSAQTATITPEATGSEAPSFAPIRFDFDSADLSDAARDELQALATWMARSGGRVAIEGHADERGTTEYNLALGQQRADAIARHLARLGVAAGRLTTITYGEERPAIEGSDESAWADNRRGELRTDR